RPGKRRPSEPALACRGAVNVITKRHSPIKLWDLTRSTANRHHPEGRGGRKRALGARGPSPRCRGAVKGSVRSRRWLALVRERGPFVVAFDAPPCGPPTGGEASPKDAGRVALGNVIL